ncbi:hypothetical protein BCR34DRAFT_495635, partial [Clohesyomyces aquaticus]
DIAKAVQYVYDHSIRHGNIGSQNILLDSLKTVLLCDFAVRFCCAILLDLALIEILLELERKEVLSI